MDLLYPEATVRDWYLKESGVGSARSLAMKALGVYLEGHLYRQFRLPHVALPTRPPRRTSDLSSEVSRVARLIQSAERPAIVVGNQTMVGVREPERVADALQRLGAPCWLGGSARGLLGRSSPIQFRHKRGQALKEADVVLVLGFPFDFRMKYGRSIGSKATVVSVNLSAAELRKNRRPQVAVEAHPAEFVRKLAAAFVHPGRWRRWFDTLREREQARDDEIARSAKPTGELVDPLYFFQRMEEKLADNAVLVADGGDFVATGSYILRPRGPLGWLDPGVFGTLGVGGGFATGAACVRPDAEVWIIYGDGSSAYSLAEFDTYVRHGLAPIAVVGTDASWAQIARDQVTILGDDVGTSLRRTAYHQVAEGYGGAGLLLDDPTKTDEVLDEAKRLAAAGRPVLVNVHLAKTNFREGSISI